jgi:hypothetical protein
VALDVGPRFGQQRFQNGAGRFLVIAMFGRRRGRAKRLFEKDDADALGAAGRFQGSRRPRLALHHLGKQRQPHGNNLAFLSQAGNRLCEK